jgi:hypothetical protein
VKLPVGERDGLRIWHFFTLHSLTNYAYSSKKARARNLTHEERRTLKDAPFRCFTNWKT